MSPVQQQFYDLAQTALGAGVLGLALIVFLLAILVVRSL